MKTIFSFLVLVTVASCTQSSKKSSGSSSTSALSCDVSTGTYYTTPGCAGYCQSFPTSALCAGTTTGTTAGGTTGTTGGGVTGPAYTKIPSDNNWQALYQNGEPTGSCASPTGSGYDLRSGTVTIAGGQDYNPNNMWSTLGGDYQYNVSPFFTSIDQAKLFFETDSVLRIRFKPRPEPKAPVGKVYCYGRVTGQAADSYGYTSLSYIAALHAVNADGSMGNVLVTRQLTTGVNSCSTTVDFSNYAQQPNGVVLVITNVQSNQGCSYQQGCTAYVPVRHGSCWQMDIEAQVDGTKSI